jgi:ABC-type phosphonate transport system ATPase subunit
MTVSNDGAPLLIGRGLHKSFGPIPALRGVDISVAAGEVLAVMGPAAPASPPCCTAWRASSPRTPER